MNAPWEPRWRGREALVAGPAALILMAASTAISAVGAISSGIAQNNAARYTAQVDQNNAIQAQDAADAQGAASEQQTKSKLGAQAAAYGASGVQTGTGSALDVMADTAVKGKLDAATLRYGGGITAGRDIAEGQLATMQGQAAETAGFLNAGSTVLTGASNWEKGTGG